MKKNLLLACVLILGINLSAQDIIGCWKLDSFTTLVNADDKDIKDMLEKDFEDTFKKAENLVYCFLPEGVMKISGGSRHKYRIEGNRLYYKIDYKSFSPIYSTDGQKLSLHIDFLDDKKTFSFLWPEIDNPEEVKALTVSLFWVKLPDDHIIEGGDDSEDITPIEEVEEIYEPEIAEIIEEIPIIEDPRIDIKAYDPEIYIIEEKDMEEDAPEDIPFEVVEQMPSFPGGDVELHKFISANLKYPDMPIGNGIQGRIVARFIVNTDGSISDIEIKKKVDPKLDKEVIRVIKAMPKWIPGKQNGKAIRTYFSLPFSFHPAR